MSFYVPFLQFYNTKQRRNLTQKTHSFMFFYVPFLQFQVKSRVELINLIRAHRKLSRLRTNIGRESATLVERNCPSISSVYHHIFSLSSFPMCKRHISFHLQFSCDYTNNFVSQKFIFHNDSNIDMYPQCKKVIAVQSLRIELSISKLFSEADQVMLHLTDTKSLILAKTNV